MGRDAGCYLTQRELDERCPNLSGAEWKVYTALAVCRNNQTMATPPVGISLIEQKTGLRRRSVFYATEKLEKLGYVSRRKDGQRIVYAFRGL